MSEAAKTPAPAPAPAEGVKDRPLEHPGRPDDRDHGKVEVSYEGYRMPFWVLMFWAAWIIWGLGYVASYVLPGLEKKP